MESDTWQAYTFQCRQHRYRPINDATLEGKPKFHATQLAAWQRGPV